MHLHGGPRRFRLMCASWNALCSTAALPP